MYATLHDMRIWLTYRRVEGMVSQDVMNNFVDRWQKQGGDLEEELYPVCEEEFVMDEELYGMRCCVLLQDTKHF